MVAILHLQKTFLAFMKIYLFFIMLPPKDPIDNKPALVRIMARRRPGDQPLTEPMIVNSLMHICVTHTPIQWVDIIVTIHVEGN